jgi:transcriptional regulator with XRE-family HTH domain
MRTFMSTRKLRDQIPGHVTERRRKAEGSKNPAFSERLKSLREVRQETQAAIAKIVGITKNLWNKYERKGQYPAADVLARIGTTTGVSLTWLLVGRGPMFAADLIPMEPFQPIDKRLHELLDMVAQIYRVNDVLILDALDRNLRAFRRALIPKLLLDAGTINHDEMNEALKKLQQ